MSKNLKLRIISAALLGPLFLFLIYFNQYTRIGVLTVCAGIIMVEWFWLSQKTQFYLRYLTMGIIYISLVYVSFLFLSFQIYEGLIGFFLLIFLSDIGGYVFGKFLKGPKLIPKISPNKTWAGLFGAMFLPFVFLVIVPFLGHPTRALIFCVFLGVSAQLSDFLISVLKRKAGTKDTGTIIPGHGGLLDRVDSMMLPSILFAGGLFFQLTFYP